MFVYTFEFIYRACRVCLSCRSFSLALLNGGYDVSYRPLGPARGFLHDDAG